MFDDSARILRHRHHFVGVLVGVLQQVVVVLLAPRHDVRRLGGDQTFAERAGDRDHLGDRPRLVGVDRSEVARGDAVGCRYRRPVAPTPSSRSRRCRCPSRSRWLPWHRSKRPARGAPARWSTGSTDRASETRSSPATGCAATLSEPGIDRPPGATSRRISPPVPVSSVVVLQFETGDADAVDVGSPDHASAGVASRHLAPALAVDVDPDEPHRCDLVADVGVGLAPHEDETAILRLDLGEQFG